MPNSSVFYAKHTSKLYIKIFNKSMNKFLFGVSWTSNEKFAMWWTQGLIFEKYLKMEISENVVNLCRLQEVQNILAPGVPLDHQLSSNEFPLTLELNKFHPPKWFHFPLPFCFIEAWKTVNDFYYCLSAFCIRMLVIDFILSFVFL